METILFSIFGNKVRLHIHYYLFEFILSRLLLIIESLVTTKSITNNKYLFYFFFQFRIQLA